MGWFNFKKKQDKSLKIDPKMDKIIDRYDLDMDIKSSMYPTDYSDPGDSYFSDDGTALSYSSLQKFYMSELWVFSAINAISSTVSAIPWNVMGIQIKDGREVMEPKKGSDLDSLIQYPSNNMSRCEFMSHLVIDLYTTGNAYVYLDGIGDSKKFKQPTSMMRINPVLVSAEMSEKGPFVGKYILTTEHGVTELTTKQVLHIKFANPSTHLVGLSPLVPAFKNINLDKLINQNQLSFYKNGARVGGVIHAQTALNKAQQATLQRSFESKYTGYKNMHRTLFLPKGMEYKPVQATAVESQLIEYAKYNRDGLISALKVPPIKLGFLEQSSYSNAEIQEKFYYTDTIMPLLSIIEDAFNLHPYITSPDDLEEIKFDTSNIPSLREDYALLATTAKDMMEAGLTTDEIRELIWNKPPLEGEFSASAKPMSVAKIEQITAQPTETTQEESNKEVKNADAARIASDVTDTTATFQDRVVELTNINVQNGAPVDVATRQAIEQATLEFQPTEVDDTPEETIESPDTNATMPITEVVQREFSIDDNEKEAEVDNIEEDDPNTETREDIHSHKVYISKDEYVMSSAESNESSDHTHYIMIEDKRYVSGPPIEKEDGRHTHKYKISGHTTESSETKEVEIESLSAWDNLSDSKKQLLVNKQKKFISETEELELQRRDELETFFNDYKNIVISSTKDTLKKNNRSYLKKQDEDDIEKILSTKELEDLVDEFIKQNHPSLNESISNAYNTALPGISVDFKLTDPIISAAVQDIEAKQVTLYDETTRKQLAKLLKSEFSRGSTINQIGKAISNKFEEINNGRAHTIARTEILSAWSEGDNMKATEIGKQFPDQEIHSTWITMLDGDVRDGSKSDANHAKLHGVEKAKGETFDDGLSKMEYPRDSKGAAGSVINCRCTVGYELKKKK